MDGAKGGSSQSFRVAQQAVVSRHVGKISENFLTGGKSIGVILIVIFRASAAKG